MKNFDVMETNSAGAEPPLERLSVPTAVISFPPGTISTLVTCTEESIFSPSASLARVAPVPSSWYECERWTSLNRLPWISRANSDLISGCHAATVQKSRLAVSDFGRPIAAFISSMSERLITDEPVWMVSTPAENGSYFSASHVCPKPVLEN